MAEDEEGTAKPIPADKATSDEDEDEDEDGDYEDEDADGADLDADDDPDVDADDNSSEQAAPAASTEVPAPARRGTLLIVGVFVAIVGVFAYFKLRTPEEVVPPAVWARYHDVANTFSIEMPSHPVESADPEPHLAATLGSRGYAVFWKPITDEERWRTNDVRILDKGTLLRRLEIEGSQFAFVFKTPQGMYAAMRTVRRGDLGYLVITGAYIDDPDLERPLRTFRFEPTPP